MEFQQLRTLDFIATARLLREGLADFGLAVNPTSDLGRMLAALDWFAGFAPDALQPDTAWKTDRQRTVRAFPRYEQALRIAGAITWARGIAGASERVRHVRKRLDRLETQDERAQDFLFELEIGARFTSLGLTITFDEPDIVFHAGEHRLTIACKRPRTIKRLAERIHEAADQVLAHKDQGIILIGAEALFHRSTDPVRKVIVYKGYPEMIAAAANEILDDAVSHAGRDISSAFERGVAGIIFCGVVTGWADRIVGESSVYHFQWIHRAYSAPGALNLAQEIANRLFMEV